MKKMLCLLLIGALAGTASAAELTLDLVRTDANGSFPMTASFEVRAMLDNTADNDGLAAYGFDFNATKDGQPFPLDGIVTVTPGMATELEAFVDRGLTNPAGYEGTMINGELVQIGAAQNTINNPGPNPPFPNGAVELNVGHTEVVLATIEVDLTDEAVYVLTVDDAFANVIDPGQAGPVYMVSAVTEPIPSDSVTVEAVSDPCPWDLNGDGEVSPLDVSVAKTNYGCNVGSGDPTCDSADLNDDGEVNPLDVSEIKTNYGPCP